MSATPPERPPADPAPAGLSPPEEPTTPPPEPAGAGRRLSELFATSETTESSVGEVFEKLVSADLGELDPRFFLEGRTDRLLRDRRVRPVVVFLQSVWPFLALIAGIYFVCGTIFYFIEHGLYSFNNSIYFSVLTFATNNIGNIIPTNGYAEALVLVMTVAELFVLAFLISTLAARADDVSRQVALGLLGTDFENHFVIIGASDVGLGAAQDLLTNGKQVAVITETADDVANIRQLGPPDRLFVTYGRLTDAELLKRVNLSKARSVVVAAGDDSTSMIVALNIRRLTPNVRVVVSVAHPELRPTMRAAGVSFVASPAEMAARVCASATYEPDVARTVDELTTSKVGSDVVEYVLTERSRLCGLTFREAVSAVLESTGSVLIGFGRRGVSGTYDPYIAPELATKLAAGDAVVLICASAARANAVREWFGTADGR